MRKQIFSVLAILFYSSNILAQPKKDSVVKIDQHYITLSEIVVSNKLDVASFVKRVMNDTTFYKAFRSLHIINYTSLNDIKMLDKNGNTKASLYSTTRQVRAGNCRKMQVLQESHSGDLYDDEGNFNYYTLQMFSGLFFTKDSVCGEDNIVKGRELSTQGLSGIEKHKQQLKMLFFNPGKKINGIPFMSGKTEIFDASMADDYDMQIDFADFDKTTCYVFTVKAKYNKKNNVVVNEMTTWFNARTFEIVARNYSLSYDAGVYDFDVKMKVEMTRCGKLLIPRLIIYDGNWKAIFKKREHGIFTATLSDFFVT